MWIDEICLRSGHSLIMGNFFPIDGMKPNLEEVRNNVKPVDIEAFGLFSSPDFNKFYPGVKPEDLKPMSEDYIHPVYRALSEVIVHKQYNPIDFGENNALKKSMTLLKGQAVKGDHEDGIHTTMGVVENVSWDEGYTSEGVKIPAGMNSQLKIDAKGNPRIARQILSDPPGIHSVSVTVSFAWDKSHPSMDTNEFFNKLGTFDKDGKMVRRIATAVKNYREISLVDHGADPFAKAIGKDGKIIMPKHAGAIYNSEEKKAQKYFSFDFKPGVVEEIENTDNPTIPTPINEETLETQNSEKMKEHLIALAALVGLTFDEGKPETFTAIKTAVEKLKADKDAADAQIVELSKRPDAAEVTTLKSFKGDTLKRLRDSYIKNLAILNAGKAPEHLVKFAERLEDAEGLTALLESSQAEVDKGTPLSCQRCGSTAINRASTKTEGEEENGDKDKKVNLTPAQIREKYRNSNASSFSSLHEKADAEKV